MTARVARAQMLKKAPAEPTTLASATSREGEAGARSPSPSGGRRRSPKSWNDEFMELRAEAARAAAMPDSPVALQASDVDGSARARRFRRPLYERAARCRR